MRARRSVGVSPGKVRPGESGPARRAAAHPVVERRDRPMRVVTAAVAVQKLQTGDFVVFEFVDGRSEEERAAQQPPLPGHVEANLSVQMHVIRARHFDPRFSGDDAEPYGRLQKEHTHRRRGVGAGGDAADLAASGEQENNHAAGNSGD